MFDKRGQAETMLSENAIEIGLGALTFLIILSILATLYIAFTSDEIPEGERDFLRVYQDINSFTPSSNPIKVPLFSRDISFEIFKPSKDIKGCIKDTMCMCYREGDNSFDDYIHNCKELTVKSYSKEADPIQRIKLDNIRNHAVLIRFDDSLAQVVLERVS